MLDAVRYSGVRFFNISQSPYGKFRSWISFCSNIAIDKLKNDKKQLIRYDYNEL